MFHFRILQDIRLHVPTLHKIQEYNNQNHAWVEILIKFPSFTYFLFNETLIRSKEAFQAYQP